MKFLNFFLPTKKRASGASFVPLWALLWAILHQMFKQNLLLSVPISFSIAWFMCFTIPAIRETHPKPTTILKFLGIFVLLAVLVFFTLQFFIPIQPMEASGRSRPMSYQAEAIIFPWWKLRNRGIEGVNRDGLKAYYRGEYGTAIKIFQDGLTSNPRSSVLHNNLGCALMRDAGYNYPSMANFGKETEVACHEFGVACSLKIDDPIPPENLLLFYDGMPPDSSLPALRNRAYRYEKRTIWGNWIRESGLYD